MINMIDDFYPMDISVLSDNLFVPASVFFPRPSLHLFSLNFQERTRLTRGIGGIVVVD